MYFICLGQFITYYVMCVQKRIIYIYIFLFLSLLLKFNIDVTIVPDFIAYSRLIESDFDFDFDYISLFSEPYFYYLGKIFKKYFTSYTSLTLFYYINFIITLSFFVWLAFIDTIATWRKLILLSLYYFLFSYVLLRNTPAYLLCGLLFYSLNKDDLCKISFSSFLFHLTSAPILAFSIFKNRVVDKKMLLFLLLYSSILKGVFTLEIFGLYEKFITYSTSEEYGVSLFHRVYFYAFICFNLFLLVYRRNVVYNYTYSFMFTTYLFLQLFSPVMGFRFSIYLIIYLMLHPSLEFNKNITRVLDIVTISLVMLSLFNLYSIQSF